MYETLLHADRGGGGLREGVKGPGETHLVEEEDGEGDEQEDRLLAGPLGAPERHGQEMARPEERMRPGFV